MGRAPRPDPAVVTELVGDAVAAPSMHNAQPWLFRYVRDSGTLLLRSDTARRLPVADPSDRGLHLGCGAALFNLRVAAAHADLRPRVALLPEPGDPGLLAEVVLAADEPEESGLADLRPAVRRRRSSRHPFTDERPADALLDGLRGAAVAEGARLVVPGGWHVQTLLDLLGDARIREAASPQTQEEIARWVTGAGPGEGVPGSAVGPRSRDDRALVRDFTAGRGAERTGADFERTPCLALLGTREDAPIDWLRAGQALERVLLQATLDGLSTSLTSQPVEWPELRWALRDPLAAVGHVQMVLRLGYGPGSPATPRRPVDDVLVVV